MTIHLIIIDFLYCNNLLIHSRARPLSRETILYRTIPSKSYLLVRDKRTEDALPIRTNFAFCSSRTNFHLATYQRYMRDIERDNISSYVTIKSKNGMRGSRTSFNLATCKMLANETLTTKLAKRGSQHFSFCKSSV